MSSHYLILLRVSSLVVWGLGVSAPTPYAQDFISGSDSAASQLPSLVVPGYSSLNFLMEETTK